MIWDMRYDLSHYWGHLAFDCAITNNLGGKVISIDFSSELFLWDKVSEVGLVGEPYGHFHSFKYPAVKLF